METKRKRRIAVACACFAGAVVVTFIVNNPFRHRVPLDDRPIHLLCPACNHAFTITHGEYYKMLKEKGAIGPGGPIAPPPPLNCPECHKDAAYAAQKCDKCGKVFFASTTVAGDYQDRCPKCGYSRAEERYKNR